MALTERDSVSDAHPGLVKAVGVVLPVLILPGLLELVPQPLYPVVVTGSHLTAAGGETEGQRDREVRRQDQLLLCEAILAQKQHLATLLKLTCCYSCFLIFE